MELEVLGCLALACGSLQCGGQLESQFRKGNQGQRSLSPEQVQGAELLRRIFFPL